MINVIKVIRACMSCTRGPDRLSSWSRLACQQVQTGIKNQRLGYKREMGNKRRLNDEKNNVMRRLSYWDEKVYMRRTECNEHHIMSNR